jgi:aspartyl-tRNA(Asn)/glutamyl-tRNA(Gln) amidotransferase subunit C
MSFSAADVAKIAKLARIKVTEEEKQALAGQIGSILSFVEQLNEVDTGEANIVASVIEQPLLWRADVVTDGGKAPDITRNAPASEYDCFVVPKVIGE